ncbi:MAG TPA: F0F1 ATP synthase subunit gamma [Candidatus Nanopelagicales bacterium]|nr:F0F1 ATP synthase subunit gamma [Candidatus Nanopelagicales bacterium]
MGAQLRVYRRRIRSVQATKKITKAMELIASSRIVKAQQRVEAALPYTRELGRAISAAASHTGGGHPLTETDQRLRERAAVLVITADRGLAGAYSSAAIKEGEQLTALLGEQGVRVVPFLVGRKAVGYYRFRGREVAASWTGFTDQPTYAHAKEIAAALLESFLTRTEDGGTDEIHIVYTHFESMVTQRPTVRRILPLEIVETTKAEAAAAGTVFPLYEFEPSGAAVLDALLPKYVENLVFTALLLSAASEHAARRRAMKSATDNAEELIKTLSRQANQARQAEITQEISEIVGGADALSASA